MRLAAELDCEICLTDISPEELDELLGLIEDGDTVEDIRRKYFEFYDDVKDRTLEKHKWSD